MIDLHTHSLFSDGELLPSELARRAGAMGVTMLAITDHADYSNYDSILAGLTRFCAEYAGAPVTVLPGVEITHAPPWQIANLVKLCRDAGARIVVAHGETVVEPVEAGTNRAAIEAGVDILAHPGFITDDDARLAAIKGVALEISGRGGHSFTNGHVASVARRCGAKLVFNTDAHAPKDLMGAAMARIVALGAGLTEDEAETMFETSRRIADRARS